MNYDLGIIIVSLIILGLLSAVGDLRANITTTSVTISWSPPFSLNVTGVDPDIWYSVFIYNVTDENNPTAILCTNCTNITETHYTFTPDYLSPCHVYNFSVVPLNGAGQGESSGDSFTFDSGLHCATKTGPFILSAKLIFLLQYSKYLFNSVCSEPN